MDYNAEIEKAGVKTEIPYQRAYGLDSFRRNQMQEEEEVEGKNRLPRYYFKMTVRVENLRLF